jgi:undecaprenyl-diphosphatase
MAVPVMFGASALKIVKYITEISESNVAMSETALQWVVLCTGMVTAFIVSVLAIKFFIGYIKKNDFTVFGYYRIVLGIAVALIFSFVF